MSYPTYSYFLKTPNSSVAKHLVAGSILYINISGIALTVALQTYLCKFFVQGAKLLVRILSNKLPYLYFSTGNCLALLVQYISLLKSLDLSCSLRNSQRSFLLSSRNNSFRAAPSSGDFREVLISWSCCLELSILASLIRDSSAKISLLERGVLKLLS